MSDQISFENPIDIEQQDGIKKTDELEQDDISTVGIGAPVKDAELIKDIFALFDVVRPSSPPPLPTPLSSAS